VIPGAASSASAASSAAAPFVFVPVSKIPGGPSVDEPPSYSSMV
jgi:hypothetical protein